MDVFDDQLESEQTRIKYRFYWKKFEEWLKGSKQIDNILDQDSDTQQDAVEDYMRYLKENKNRNSIRTMFNPVKLVLKRHPNQRRKFINFDMIKIPKAGKRAGHESWSQEDIVAMYRACQDDRDRAVLTMFISTGGRVGAMHELNLRNVLDMEGGYKLLTFYENDSMEYPGFLTREASRDFDNYLEQRSTKEKPTADSPAIASEQIPYKRLGISGIQIIIKRLIRDSHSKSRVKLGVGRYDHYNISLTHGFRKWWNDNVLSIPGINPYYKEKMFAHKTEISPLDTTYHTGKTEALFEEFKKYEALLTIDQASSEKLKREKAENEKEELEKKLVGPHGVERMKLLERKIDDLRFDLEYWKDEALDAEEILYPEEKVTKQQERETFKKWQKIQS